MGDFSSGQFGISEHLLAQAVSQFSASLLKNVMASLCVDRFKRQFYRCARENVENSVETAARLIEAPEGAATRRRRRRFPIKSSVSHAPISMVAGAPEGSDGLRGSGAEFDTINDSLRPWMRLSGGDGARFSARDQRKSRPKSKSMRQVQSPHSNNVTCENVPPI